MTRKKKKNKTQSESKVKNKKNCLDAGGYACVCTLNIYLLIYVVFRETCSPVHQDFII